MTKTIVLSRESLKILEDLVRRSRKLVVLYTADYGCAECEVFEKLLKKHRLDKYVDVKVIIPQAQAELALENGIDVIPLVHIFNNGKKTAVYAFSPSEMLKKFRQAVEDRIKLYRNLSRRYRQHAKKISSLIGEKVCVNAKVILLIIRQIEELGKPYCPCRTEKSEKTICPCFYHVEELRRHGRCRCGLFYKCR